MCFAPRYRNGPMARPWFETTNAASRLDTLCAKAASGNTSASTTRAASAATREYFLFMFHFGFVGLENPDDAGAHSESLSIDDGVVLLRQWQRDDPEHLQRRREVEHDAGMDEDAGRAAVRDGDAVVFGLEHSLVR